MMQLNHPRILEFGYIHRTLYFCRDEAALEATAEQIKKTVPKDHPELPLLRGSYATRREEIREAARLDAEKKAKEAAEKVVVE